MNRSAGPGGHFGWKDVGEQKAYEKACQALRENAPEIRKQQSLTGTHKNQQHLATPVGVDDSRISGDGKAAVATAVAASSPGQGEP
jgi:hypothetical protein